MHRQGGKDKQAEAPAATIVPGFVLVANLPVIMLEWT